MTGQDGCPSTDLLSCPLWRSSVADPHVSTSMTRARARCIDGEVWPWLFESDVCQTEPMCLTG